MAGKAAYRTLRTGREGLLESRTMIGRQNNKKYFRK